MLGTVAELLLGGACPGCGRPGWRVCHRCRAQLLVEPRRVVRPVDGLPPTWACADYDGPAHAMVVAVKEQGVWRAAPLLGEVMARAVAGALLATQTPAVTLVPVPSAAAAVRRRGLDSTRRLAEEAATALRARGIDVATAPCLEQRRGVADQAGLGAADRFANLTGSVRCRTTVPAGPLVVVDDVVTTGASLLAASAALTSAGGDVVACACVAARGWS